jgi:hypothetical protein
MVMIPRTTELIQQSLLGSSVFALLAEITHTVTIYVLKLFRSFSDGLLSYPTVKSSIRSGVSDHVASSSYTTIVGSAKNTTIVSIILTSLLLCTWCFQSTSSI